MIKCMLAAAVVSTLVACGGGGGSTSTSGGSSSSSTSSGGQSVLVPYDGVWYLESNDEYFEIANNMVNIRYCSVNDGYALRESTEIVGSILTTDITGMAENQMDVALVGNQLSLSYKNSRNITVSLLLDKHDSVPSVCVNDAIEITSVSPETAVEGVATEFSVSIIYRLANTQDEIELRVGANKNRVDGFTGRLQQDGFTGPETSSFNFAYTETPVYYSSPNQYLLSVRFKTSAGERLANSNFPIAVTPAN